MKTSKTENRY